MSFIGLYAPLPASEESFGQRMEVSVNMNIHDKIIQMIEKEKALPVPVKKESNLYTDLGFNSLSFIRLLLNIEEAYLICFDIAEMEMCLQIDQLVAIVKRKVKGDDANHDQALAAE